MTKQSSYLVPSKTVSAEQEINKSRFISTVGRANNIKKAKDFVSKISETYSDATHNCYAFIAGNPGTSDIGFGDNGEVSGTAGKPMLSILQHKKIGEIVVVVSRYFGGTKLGTGGLVRAYSSSLQIALDKLPLEKCVATKKAEIIIGYQLENTIRKTLEQFSLSINDTIYKNDILFRIDIPENIKDKLIEEIMNQTRGKVKLNFED